MGLRLLGSQVPVYGSCVRRGAHAQTDRLDVLTGKLHELLNRSDTVKSTDILTWDTALAPGYGQMGPETCEALTLMAQTEGLFLDPVYTAKGFAAVLGLLREQHIPRGARVLFVHTGGFPALFGYQNAGLGGSS